MSSDDSRCIFSRLRVVRNVVHVRAHPRRIRGVSDGVRVV